MQRKDTGEPGRTVTARGLLLDAEDAFLCAEFRLVRPLLQRFKNEFGTSDTDDTTMRYAVLRAALAARAGNWPEAARWCPDRDDLDCADTGVVHSLAVSALRRLSEEERHAEANTAALAIVLWAHLLDEENLGEFHGLLSQRRDTPIPEELWEEARHHLHGRVTDLLHALDVRAGRDALAAWRTAWEAECDGLGPVVVPSAAAPDGLIPLGLAAAHLVRHGRRIDLLDAYTARHPDTTAWTVDAPDHRACADALAQALAGRAQDRERAGEWISALSDFSTAARLGRSLGAKEQEAVLRAAANVGRTFTGRGNSTVTRIQGLDLAHALLPQHTSVAAELTAELVSQGQQVFKSDPAQSRRRFARALDVTPGDPGARSGLDDHLRADLDRGDKLCAADVQGLLGRHPECVPARKWLGDHYAELAMTATSAPDTDGTRTTLERRVELLSMAVDIAGAARTSQVREQLDTAVLLLAENLEATASPSDVIELFLRDLMRTGVSARFDQTVESAYLNRAREREQVGDPGGAQRDRVCAKRIGARLPAQGLLFGPSPGPRSARHGHDDTEQEALF
ncbi:hypothetical protein [Streptomyces zagrosensis]|uniref:Uncharacterized protein n=1 Tax=Streptomyces zagrosensis TaxID=1042984 RepID=A0A7W9QDW0_9ACTN|nr:hypothetical protein [Streptomyces zagrosensis]MBB5937207.1 hypothetical protein [Streptomyces zagrosensis]